MRDQTTVEMINAVAEESAMSYKSEIAATQLEPTAAEARAQAEELTKELEKKRVEAGAANVDIVNRHACHVAIAQFWTNFNPTASVPADAGVVEPRISASQNIDKSKRRKVEATENPVGSLNHGGEPHDNHVAEMFDDGASSGSVPVELPTDGEPSTDTSHSTDLAPTPESSQPKPVGEPPQPCRLGHQPDKESSAAQDGTHQTPDAILPPNLDPKAAAKLKLLRRLNSNKSLAELLAQIATEEPEQPPPKKKKKWFSWK